MRELQLLTVATFFAIMLGGGLFLFVAGDGVPGLSSQYSPGFRVVDESQYGPTTVLVDRKNYVFRSEEEFHAFWELVYGNEPTARRAPVVSFAQHHVIAVMAGVKPSGGYDIYIRDIFEKTDERLVEVVLRVPGEGCVVSEARTNPYQMVVVKKTTKPLRAVESVERYSCDS